jgi:hypothetical protein
MQMAHCQREHPALRAATWRRLTLSGLLVLATGGAALSQPVQIWTMNSGATTYILETLPEPGVNPDVHVLRTYQRGQLIATTSLGQGADPRVRVWNQQKLSVTFQQEIVIVDLLSRAVTDRFFHEGASASEDARFILFRQLHAKYTNDSAVYLVYDMSVGAAANRMNAPSNDLAGRLDAGHAVYPEFNRTAQSYEQESGIYHFSVHDFVWVDAAHAVFVDARSPDDDTLPSSLAVVLVDLTNGPSLASVRSADLDLNTLIDPTLLSDALPPSMQVGIEDITLDRVSDGQFVVHLTIRKGLAVRITSTVEVVL